MLILVLEGMWLVVCLVFASMIAAVAVDAVLILFKNRNVIRDTRIKKLKAALSAADALADKTESFLAKLGTKKDAVAKAIEEYQIARKKVEK